MKKIFVFTVLLCIAPAYQGPGASAAARGSTLHFFTSGVCPACARAERDLPAIMKRHPGITLATYEVRNARNQVTEANRRNIGLLVSMLRQINARTGGRPFLYEHRTPHAFALVNGVLYYEKKISESTTVKKEVPLPLFIIGDRAYMGYRPDMLDQALARHTGVQ